MIYVVLDTFAKFFLVLIVVVGLGGVVGFLRCWCCLFVYCCFCSYLPMILACFVRFWLCF